MRPPLSPDTVDCMNISVYVFKKVGRETGAKVESFPTALDKGTQKVVGDIRIEGERNAALVVRRNGNLMYYIYAVNVDDDIFGFIFIVNNAYLAHVDSLSRFCSDMIGTIAARHLLLKWSSAGQLCFTDSRFVKCSDEASQVLMRLEEIRNVSVFNKAIALPLLDYGAETKHVVMNCWNSQELPAIPQSHRQVEVVEMRLPKVDFHVADVIHSLHDTNLSWEKQYDELTEKYTRLSNQKKRMKWVIILGLCMVAGGVVLFAVNKNLKRTQSNLSEAHTAIDSLSVEKAVLISDVDKLYNVSEIYSNEIKSLKSDYITAIDRISYLESKMPVEVTSMRLIYIRDGYSYSGGTPVKDQVSAISFDVKYKVSRFKGVDISKYPSVELYRPAWYDLKEQEANANLIEEEQPEIQAEAESADCSRPKQLYLALRCYYKPYSSGSLDYVLKGVYGFTLNISSSSSGSVSTPSFSMGFTKFPAGAYRIELWDTWENKCMYYTVFTIS